MTRKQHPNIGRTAAAGLHERVISRGKSDHPALDDDVSRDRVVVLAVRRQREAGCR